jgi:hypothetical protein
MVLMKIWFLSNSLNIPFQWVELFLGHLLEFLDELDYVILLLLAHVVGVKFDLLELFNGVGLVFALRAPYRVAHHVGHMRMLMLFL